MKRLRSTLAILALAAAIGAAPQIASAAVFTIDDTSPDDTITIDAAGFGFLIINGISFSGLPVTTITLPESAGAIPFSGTWFDLNAATSSYRVVFVEPEAPSIVSDVLIVDYSSLGGELGVIGGSFSSDLENNLGLVSDSQYAGYTVYVEDSRGFDFSNSLLSARAVSDTVPEPAILSLLALGLAGFAFARRRTLR